MLKKILLAIFLLSSALVSYAQTADEVYNKYLDFNLARLQGETNKSMDLGQQIMPDTAKLTPKVRIDFCNSMAKLFEDDSQSVKAIEFYEKVVAARPAFYVAHRALGYLYIKGIIDADKLLASPSTDANYITSIRKALPHLEKAQACDPTDDTYALIQTLYKNIGDTKSLGTLNERLKGLKKNCEDILSD